MSHRSARLNRMVKKRLGDGASAGRVASNGRVYKHAPTRGQFSNFMVELGEDFPILMTGFSVLWGRRRVDNILIFRHNHRCSFCLKRLGDLNENRASQDPLTRD